MEYRIDLELSGSPDIACRLSVIGSDLSLPMPSSQAVYISLSGSDLKTGERAVASL